MKTMFIAGCIAVCSVSAYAAAFEGVPDRDVVYKRVGDTELKLHIFNPPNLSESDKRPAIVFFFGGGWFQGHPRQFYPHCEYLASRGMVAMSAEYRVSSRNKTTPKECVMDGKSAVRWIRQHAAELGIAPDKVMAGGGSAGGHVAAATGTTKGFEEDGEDLGISSRPCALVLFNPVFDNGPRGYGYDQVKAYWKQISPMHNIDSNTPPTIVFLGTKDALIPAATAEAYQKRMQESGNRCDLHLYEGQPHGFFNYNQKENYTKTVIAMDRFLASLGYLVGEPTIQGAGTSQKAAVTSVQDGFVSRLWAAPWCVENVAGASLDRAEIALERTWLGDRCTFRLTNKGARLVTTQDGRPSG